MSDLIMSYVIVLPKLALFVGTIYLLLKLGIWLNERG